MRVNPIIKTVLSLVVIFSTTACVENPTLVRTQGAESSESGDGVNDPNGERTPTLVDPERRILPPDEGNADDVNRRIDDPTREIDEPAFCRDRTRSEAFSIQPDVTRGANVVFLIDDSGSMGNEIKGVVNEIQPFVDGLLQASNNNYRVLFLFDETRHVIRRNFDNQNPFKDQIDNESAFFVRSETWSSWADAAFYRAFGSAAFTQTVNPMPLDNFPNTSESVTLENCQAPGDYFRPRTFRRGGHPISTCIKPDANALPVDSLLLPGFSVSFVVLSDDDTNAHPEVALDMFEGALAPLGTDTPIIYHSIVGTIQGTFDGVSGNQIDRKGVNHMALSDMTGGRVHDIRQYDQYDLILNQLKEDIIFGAQAVDLSCSFDIDPQVTFNGNPVNPANYVVQLDSKKINFLPDAFIGYEDVASIEIQVSY